MVTRWPFCAYSAKIIKTIYFTINNMLFFRIITWVFVNLSVFFSCFFRIFANDWDNVAAVTACCPLFLTFKL